MTGESDEELWRAWLAAQVQARVRRVDEARRREHGQERATKEAIYFRPNGGYTDLVPDQPQGGSQ